MRRRNFGIAWLVALIMVIATLVPTAASVPLPKHQPTPGSGITFTHKATAGAASFGDIHCYPINVQNPHESGHFPGTVVDTATETCTAPVQSIAISVTLWRQVTLVDYSGTWNYFWTSSGSATASTPCSDDYYQGYGQVHVVPPPGYQPPSGDDSAWSAFLFVSCP